jgi:Bacterial Ig domain
MRTLLSIIGQFLIAVIFVTVANAESFEIKWDPAGGNRAFYRVYVGEQPGVYRAVKETPWTGAKITGLQGGRTYYVTVRSVNGVGIESENGPEIQVDLPNPPIALSVVPASEQITPWGDLIAPAAFKIKATLGISPSEIARVEIPCAYTKPDGSSGSFQWVLTEPPFEAVVTEIGPSINFGLNPYVVLKNGQTFYGLVNEGEGLKLRVRSRVPKHRLRATWNQFPLIVSTPVSLELQVDDIGIPVRKVVFSSGNVVIGEDLTPPYSIEWKNTAAGYVNIKAEVFYHELDSGVCVPSNIVGIHYSRPPALLGVTASDQSGGKILLRGDLTNPDGFQVAKVQFLEGDSVIGEDSEPPFEIAWQSVPGKASKVIGRAIFASGHILSSDPITLGASTPNSGPEASLLVPSSSGTFSAPANVEMEALVTPNGNAIQKVQFLEGDQILGEDAAAPYTFSWFGVSVRNAFVRARVFYGDGLTVDTAPVAVVVVNPKPTAVLNVSVPNGGWIAPASVAIEVAVNANGNGIQRVQFLEGGAVIGEVAASPYRFDWIGVTARSTSVSARVHYGDGLTVDTAPVAVVVVNPKPTAVLSVSVPNGGWSAPASVGMEAIINANGNVIQKVQFLELGTVLNEDTTAPYGFMWVGVSPRSTAVSARIFYEGGGVIETAPVAVVVSSGQPPTVAMEVLDANSDFRAPASLTLRARVDSKGYEIQKVSFLSGGVTIGEITLPPFQMTWSDVAAGAKKVVARVTYGGGAVIESAPVNINISDSLPAPWKTIDVGEFNFPGSVETLDDRPVSFLVSGSGVLKLGRPSDSFRFVYQPLSSNGEIEATFSAEGGVDGSEVIGLMLRENLGESSPFVFVGIGSTPFLYRQRAGSPSTTTPTLPIKATRIGIKRLVKAGGDSLVIRYYDENPATGNPRWINVRNVPGGMVLPGTVYVGLVVASGKPGSMATGLVTNPVVYE